MQDEPGAPELLDAVARFLREEAAPALSGRAAFLARVAINAVELARREIMLAPAAAEAEAGRLRALLSAEGELGALNKALVAQIREGGVNMETPGLLDHLWATTLDKLAVDQPGYAGYTHALALLKARDQQER